MMKSDTLEKNNEVIKRQLEIDSKIYVAAEDILSIENKILGKASRSSKKFLKDILPELIGDGISYRKGKIYTPVYLLSKLSRDSKWIKLKAKAETAMEELLAYQKNAEEQL